MADSKPSSSTTTRKPKSLTSRPAKAIKTPLSAELVGDSDDCDEETSREPRKRDAKLTEPTATATTTKPTAATPNSWRLKQSKKRKSTSPASNRAIANGNGAVKDSLAHSTAEDNSNVSSLSRDPSPMLFGPTTPAPVRAAHAKPLEPLGSKGTAPSRSRITPDSHSEKHQVLDSTSEEESESGNAGADEDESEDESASSDKTSIQSPKNCTPTYESTPQTSLLPYEPPPDFEPAFISFHPSSQVSEILASSNLAGKQIWHITIPSSVPVTAIKEVSAQSLQSGKPILSYKGADYSLVPKTAAETSNPALLLPSSRRNDYQQSTLPILRTLHLQQFVKVPTRAYQNAEKPSPKAKPQTHVKAVRQQPPGLKMRYHAFGTSDHSESDISATIAFKASEFRIPDVSVRPSKKRKLSNNVADSTELYPNMTKKLKARHEINPHTENSARDINSPSNGKLGENSQSSVASPVDIHANAVNGVVSSVEKKREQDRKQHKDQVTPPASQSILPTDLMKEAEIIMPEEVVKNGAGINTVPPEIDIKAPRAQSREERRKRKEMKKVIPAKAEESPLAEQNAPIQQGSRTQAKEHPIHLPTPRHSSPHKTTARTKDSQVMLHISSQSTPHKETKETKEEKAKRKQDQNKRNVASDFM